MNWQISSHWEDGALAEFVAAAQPGAEGVTGGGGGLGTGAMDVMPCDVV